MSNVIPASAMMNESKKFSDWGAAADFVLHMENCGYTTSIRMVATVIPSKESYAVIQAQFEVSYWR